MCSARLTLPPVLIQRYTTLWEVPDELICHPLPRGQGISVPHRELESITLSEGPDESISQRPPRGQGISTPRPVQLTRITPDNLISQRSTWGQGI